MTPDQFDVMARKIDYPQIRLDEHGRACGWCAIHLGERCKRAETLIRAVELQDHIKVA